MELSNLLSGSDVPNISDRRSQNAQSFLMGSNTTMAGIDGPAPHRRMVTPPASYHDGQSHKISPFGSPTPKSVSFELLFPESPQYRARLPMRVQIFPHDTTDSIVTTVKNFYGLYAGPGGAKGVSFEDEQGNTLIARYENLRNNMVVYVRVIEEPTPPGIYGPSSYHSGSPIVPQTYYTGEGNHMPPPQPAQALNYGQPPSRPTSRSSYKRSTSPNGRGRRSASVSTNPPPMKKSRSRSGFKSRGSSAHGSFADNHSDAMNGYSSGDGAPGSVSSKTKSEHLGNTEISLDNIVEGGRRKRAKFESSVSLFASQFYHLLIDLRNYHCLLRRRCQRLPRTLPYHRLAALSITEHPSHSRTPPTILSQILKPCNHHIAIAMALGNQVYILHRLLMLDVREVARHTLQTDNHSAHQMAIVLVSFLRQTRLSVVACQRKIRMLQCN